MQELDLVRAQIDADWAAAALPSPTVTHAARARRTVSALNFFDGCRVNKSSKSPVRPFLLCMPLCAGAPKYSFSRGRLGRLFASKKVSAFTAEAKILCDP